MIQNSYTSGRIIVNDFACNFNAYEYKYAFGFIAVGFKSMDSIHFYMN